MAPLTRKTPEGHLVARDEKGTHRIYVQPKGSAELNRNALEKERAVLDRYKDMSQEELLELLLVVNHFRSQAGGGLGSRGLLARIHEIDGFLGAMDELEAEANIKALPEPTEPLDPPK